MHHHAWTATSIKLHRSELNGLIQKLIPLKESVLKEAHARGLGFRTEAGLKAALKSTPVLSEIEFDNAQFVQRIAELVDDFTADAIYEMVSGVELDISVVKHPSQRQRAGLYTDIAYDVKLSVAGISEAALNDDILFHLPEFGLHSGVEPYRVDSAHDRRAEVGYRKTRFGTGQATIVAKLVKGHWHGGFFVYDLKHQIDDTNCLRSLRAALARAVLPRLPTRVRCTIFRPDNYQAEARRVEVRLPPGMRQFLGTAHLQFDIPQLPKRRFSMKSEYGIGNTIGCFVDGLWVADLYSNGIEEANNPTPLETVKRVLIEQIEHIALRAGYESERKMTPIFGDSGKMVGSVQLKNGFYEAWRRARTAEKPGNSHKLVGRFENFHEAVSAVKMAP